MCAGSSPACAVGHLAIGVMVMVMVLIVMLVMLKIVGSDEW